MSSRFRRCAFGVCVTFAFAPARASGQERSFYYQRIVVPNLPNTPVATETPTGYPSYAGFHPTTLAIAPDGQLFFAQRNGKIYRLTLTGAFQIVPGSFQQVDTIYNHPMAAAGQGRTVTGMVFGPAPNGWDLFVSHSDSRVYADLEECPDPTGDPTTNPQPSVHTGTCSGTVTRVSSASHFANPADITAIDIVTGLPRSRRDHGPNGLAFKDGKLYLAQAGMTNLGLPCTTCDGWSAEEAPKSAAILEIDLSAPIPSAPALYATGLRNPYDLLWHSNQKLYANDNGPNANSGPKPDGNCAPSTGNPPPPRPDELNLIQPAQYYGHPNPNCLWRNACNSRRDG